MGEVGDALEKRVEKYRARTQEALEKVSVCAKDEQGKEVAKEFLAMAKNYFSDACHFQEQGEMITALAAFSYAHAWLDAGVRARVLEGKDDKLFTVP